MRKRLTAVLVPLALVSLLLAGCSREGNVNVPEPAAAPALPSVSTMSMDLSVFDAAQVDAQAIREGGYEDFQRVAGTDSKLNFINAAVRVYFLNLVVCAALVQPVAAFGVAVHSVPQPQSDGSWLWNYILVDGAVEYSVFLNGKDMGDYTAWRMEVSSNDPSAPLDHFLWFEGKAQKDDTAGYWQFYEPVAALPAALVTAGVLSTPGVQSIRIDWENRAGNEHEPVFLVNKPGVPEEGSTLTYSVSPAVSSVDFVDAKAGTGGMIAWRPDGSGSIEWPDYRDGDRCCWDTHQYDAVCPE